MTTLPGNRDEWTRWLGERADEIRTGVLFSTRLPVAAVAPGGGATIASAVWTLPIAGLIVGVIAAVVYALAHRFGVPAWPAAALAIAAGLALTGALHEDGLADTLDGFGGGRTREQKLDIMRDSRIGTYGVCGLAISILIRAGALASLAEPSLVAWALIATHTAGRATLPALMYLVPPARAEGLSHGAGRPSREQAVAAAVLGVVVLFVCLGFWAALVSAIVLVVLAALMARLCEMQIGGQTGDVLGALEQAGEIAVLLVAAAAA